MEDQDKNTLEDKQTYDLTELRKVIENKSGKEYWKSLDDLAQTGQFQQWASHEFPQEGMFWERSTTRRNFLQLMGSMIAMAGLAGCTREPVEKIVPYVKAPEDIIAGKPLYFATAVSLGGYARGLLVESHMGRPTKVEGNPEHPDSLGAADSISQASVLSLYDPDRSQVITHQGVLNTWDNFIKALQSRLALQDMKKGAGLRILTEAIISPTLAAQIASVLAKYPEARWHQFGGSHSHNAYRGAELAFGKPLAVQYNIAAADVIWAIDSDFLERGPGSIAYAKAFARRRRAENNGNTMNRLYSVESTYSSTGAMADHRLALRPSDIRSFLVAAAVAFGFKISSSETPAVQANRKWLNAVVKDLKAHAGKSLIVVGSEQSAEIHALAYLVNSALGNIGKTLHFTQPIEANPVDPNASLTELKKDLDAGKVEDLIILGANPVYKAPMDLGFEQSMQKAPFRAHWGLYQDETAKVCQWHVPAAHYLESWSDARAFDGTVSLIQPLIQPLYYGKSIHEITAALEGKSGQGSHDIVQNYWKNSSAALSGKSWDKALHDGVIRGTAFAHETVSVRSDLSLNLNLPSNSTRNLEVTFRPDPTIGEGDFANNGWLQELPKPMTQITWENAVLISPKDAEELGVRCGENHADVVHLTVGERTIEGPIWIMPGHAQGCVTVHQGYGRRAAGKLGSKIGFDANALRTSVNPSIAYKAEIKKAGKRQVVACIQDHNTMAGRNLVRVSTLEDYKQHPDFAQHVVHEPKPTDTLYKPSEHLKAEHQWAMTIDLNACIGCGACTVACQSENNIPVVGKDQVSRGREMHWIRIDRYNKGDMDSPEVYHQPVPCQQCENAPCEPVCPVGATTHSDEGLNEMTYNRCVGTRYCSNNCSYKVRRFNFYHYADKKTPSIHLQRNPDVTVRTRGIMEKCTYCVQRINTARIDAKKENRQIRDGEIVTACQQTCPTEAIQFGNINDKDSKISQEKANPRNYGILTDLGTRPRTTYLARLRNPNPELEETASAGHAEGHHS